MRTFYSAGHSGIVRSCINGHKIEVGDWYLKHAYPPNDQDAAWQGPWRHIIECESCARSFGRGDKLVERKRKSRAKPKPKEPPKGVLLKYELPPQDVRVGDTVSGYEVKRVIRDPATLELKWKLHDPRRPVHTAFWFSPYNRSKYIIYRKAVRSR